MSTNPGNKLLRAAWLRSLFADEAAAEAPPVPSALPEAARLDLADLIEDANGEVVLFNDSNLAALELRAEARLVERGEAGDHVTATGEDVSGFQFVSFDNGLTLYFPSGLELIVVKEPAAG